MTSGAEKSNEPKKPGEGAASRPDWHLLSGAEVLRAVQSREAGLGEQEAGQRLAREGPNELERAASTPAWKLLLEQFTNLLVVILMAAAAVSLFIGDIAEAVVILVIVVLAAVLGFLQEARAERALQALRDLAVPTAKVLRDGRPVIVSARDLVVGDLIPVQAGDVIPADARLLEALEVRADEALLTGESAPVDKKAVTLEGDEIPLAERFNMIYSGTALVYGRGRAVVVATGMQTEFGEIARMLQQQELRRSPLQQDLNRLGKLLGIGSLVLAGLMAVMGVARGYGLLEMFIWGVALAVAVIPEALPAVVTISLALGVKRMAQRRCLVRRLPAVETLGATQVICTDKTGTLTAGQMTVRRVLLGAEQLEVSGAGFRAEGQFLRRGTALSRDELPPALRQLLRAAVLCNDASLDDKADDPARSLVGDPTEVALLVAARKAGIDPDTEREHHPRLYEIGFSSDRKRMTTVQRVVEGGRIAYSKGAPEVIVAACQSILDGEVERPLDEAERQRLLQQAEQLGGEALRAIAVAYKRVDASEKREEIEEGMIYLGCLGLIDPPRPEARTAVERCQRAGIRTMMITGDHQLTARVVAEELGILTDGLVVSGPEIDRTSDEWLAAKVNRIQLFSRATPQHKLRIVEALQRRGEVVAMTGDGVNDAPSLKRADIGVAMGISGTGVSREAAEMILTNDNFSSIVAAVEEGRRIFDNIRKYLVFLLSGNMGAIFGLTGALLLGFPLPLVAVQILFINMILDGLPAIALGVEPAEAGLMARPPRPPGYPMLDRLAVGWIVGVGLLIAAIAFWGFERALAAGGSHERAMTVFFATLVCCRLFNGLNCRSFRESVLTFHPLSNSWLLYGIASALGLTLVVIYTPGLNRLFRLVPLSAGDWVTVIGSAAITLIVVELAKLLARAIQARRGPAASS